MMDSMSLHVWRILKQLVQKMPVATLCGTCAVSLQKLLQVGHHSAHLIATAGGHGLGGSCGRPGACASSQEARLPRTQASAKHQRRQQLGHNTAAVYETV